MATAEFSKFAGIVSAALSQHHLLGFEIAQLYQQGYIENLQLMILSGHRTGKGQFSFQSQRRAMPNNAQTTAQLYSSHTLVK